VAKYGNFVYGGAKYGETRKLAYSVAPLDLVILSFSTAYLTWFSPSGAFTKIRLVRNQVGFPETSEDGVIIWEEYATEGTVSRSSFTDGLDNPNSIGIVSERPIFYSMFLFTSDKVWINAGNVADTVPGNHDAQKRIMDIIPKVYTSAIQSPLGVTDETSALYSFVDGLSFTYEQLLTELDLLKPVHSSDISSYLLLPIETSNVGLDQEPNIPIKNQKRLVREAFYMYSHKGLKSGVETYVESLSGYAPTVTVSPNLLLTPQDSTFYNSVGNWTATNATISASNEQVPATGTKVIDTIYSCKIVASNAGSMKLGNTTPIKKGVPLKPSTEYTASCKLKSPASAGNITLSVSFYDKNGDSTGSASSATAVAANNTWKTASKTFTTPSDASYADLTVAYSASGTYYVDQVCIQLGDTVAYDEARAVDIFLDPNKTNYIKNPSFEVNATDSWSVTGATVTRDSDVSDLAYSGTKSAKIVATGAWTFTSNTFPITTGKYYTASGLAKTTANLTVSFIARDSMGDIVETVDPYLLGTFTNWSKFQATDLVGAATAVTYEIVFSGGAGTYYLDCLQFEKGISSSEYFDGSLPSQFGTVWEGTADNSFTHLYTNKPFKVPRVGLTINDWLPPNTMWRVSTYAGVEYTNLTV
jgi:hypothetical protein